MNAAMTGSLAALLRLAEGIPSTTENYLGRGELIRGLNNILNALEKSEDDD